MGPDVSTTAIEPSIVKARRILDLKNKDKGESPLKASSHPAHHPRYTKTKERPARIHESEMIITRAMDRYTRAPNGKGMLSVQSRGGDDQHGEGKDHQPHGKPVEGAALVDDKGGRPVRKTTPRDSKNNYENGLQDVSYEVAN